MADQWCALHPACTLPLRLLIRAVLPSRPRGATQSSYTLCLQALVPPLDASNYSRPPAERETSLARSSALSPAPEAAPAVSSARTPSARRSPAAYGDSSRCNSPRPWQSPPRRTASPPTSARRSLVSPASPRSLERGALSERSVRSGALSPGRALSPMNSARRAGSLEVRLERMKRTVKELQRHNMEARSAEARSPSPPDAWSSAGRTLSPGGSVEWQLRLAAGEWRGGPRRAQSPSGSGGCSDRGGGGSSDRGGGSCSAPISTRRGGQSPR